MIKTHQKEYTEIVQCIQNLDDFIITTHVRPDGDSVASVLIMATILDLFKKKYRIILDDTVPAKLHFLDMSDKIEKVTEGASDFVHHAAIVLDSSDLDRIGRSKNLFHQNEKIINIDHHPGNSRFGHINLIDSRASSTVELVHPLINLSHVPWTGNLATLVYTGILSDTGRFLFANTSADAMAICADMVKKGAEPSTISEMLYNRITPATMQAYAKALSSLEFHLNDQITCIYLLNETLCLSGNVDTEGFVDTIAGINGVKASFIMMENNPGEFRVSFRSKGEIDTNEVAGIFGGGGHVRASGCNIQGSLNDVKNKILNVLERKIEKIQ